jgi:hypothetical protein
MVIVSPPPPDHRPTHLGTALFPVPVPARSTSLRNRNWEPTSNNETAGTSKSVSTLRVCCCYALLFVRGRSCSARRPPELWPSRLVSFLSGRFIFRTSGFEEPVLAAQAQPSGAGAATEGRVEERACEKGGKIKVFASVFKGSSFLRYRLSRFVERMRRVAKCRQTNLDQCLRRHGQSFDRSSDVQVPTHVLEQTRYPCSSPSSLRSPQRRSTCRISSLVSNRREAPNHAAMGLAIPAIETVP